MTTRSHCIAFIVFVCGALVLAHSAARADANAPHDIATLFAELNVLDTPGYTGGLHRRNRALAEKIRAAMEPQFPLVACKPYDWRQGTIIGFSDEATQQGTPPKNLDPNLAQLLKAFEHERQEVRDTATFVIGLLGPSAVDAEPFLRKRFADNHSDAKVKGNWHNDAFAKVACLSVAAADFRQVIPDSMLPPQEPWIDFLRKASVFKATLYLDEDIEYPLYMMGYAYSNYGISDYAEAAVPLLARILENDKLSTQKHIEAASALGNLKPEMARLALPALLRHVDAKDETLRWNITEALVSQKHKAAIPLLIERIERYDHYSWEADLCLYGPAAIAAEDALLKLIGRDGAWPTDVRSAVSLLGCIHSTKSIPTLIGLLPFPDWNTQRAIAGALGEIGDTRQEVVNKLEGLFARHWSSIVRNAAESALIKLGRRELPTGPQTHSDSEEVEEIVFARPINDHGLPWCDERGKYSIDGTSWFRIKWTKRAFAKAPKGFPKTLLVEYGTRQFVRVDDGWLYGSDLGHYDGSFQHVSDAGTVTELDEPWHTNLTGFVRDRATIFAFGYQVLKSDHAAGVLFKVGRDAKGDWKGSRIAALPSPANAYADGPNGEVLLSDGPNDYAVIANEIVPLKCDRVFEGSYFTQSRGAGPRSR